MPNLWDLCIIHCYCRSMGNCLPDSCRFCSPVSCWNAFFRSRSTYVTKNKEQNDAGDKTNLAHHHIWFQLWNIVTTALQIWAYNRTWLFWYNSMTVSEGISTESSRMSVRLRPWQSVLLMPLSNEDLQIMRPEDICLSTSADQSRESVWRRFCRRRTVAEFEAW